MASNLDAIVEAIAAQLRTVTELKNVVTYEPDQIGTQRPMVFLDMEGWTLPAQVMHAMTMDWQIHAYLILAPISAKASEAARLGRTLMPKIIFAMGQDLQAGGTIQDGQVLLMDAPKGRRTVGDTTYYARRLEFRVVEFLTDTYAIKAG